MTIYTITYNEELMLPYFIQHYRERFPNCNIVVYDNQSTDSTQQIAIDNECSVVEYNTGGKLSDSAYLNIKNNCWKGQSDWVIVADCDEFLDIWEEELIEEQASIISVEAYNMVNDANNLDISSISRGVRSTSYDKAYCFHAGKIREINYGAGAHSCSPTGLVGYSQRKYRAFHYKYINIEYMQTRHAIFAARRSDENIKKGWAEHYAYPPEQIKQEFLDARKKSIKIGDYIHSGTGKITFYN